MRHLIKTQTKPFPDAVLRGLAVPTTLLWGRHDRVAPLSVGQSASTKFGWPLQVIDDAGHVPHIEHPGAFLGVLAAIESTSGDQAEGRP